MKQLSPETFAQLTVWLAVLFGLIAVAVILLAKLRGNAQQSEDSTSQLLSNLQDLRQEGDISDAEYRTIKSRLNAGTQQEWGDTDRAG